MLRDLGNLRSERHPGIHSPYSQHFCSRYKRQFHASMRHSPLVALFSRVEVGKNPAKKPQNKSGKNR